MENELIARYIYAVTRHLPPNMRPDVEKELDSLIADMLQERCGDILPTDKDIKAVLTELGTPGEVAAKYSGDENRALISGLYFIYYKQILKIVLPIVVICVTVGNIINLAINFDPAQNPFLAFGLGFGQILAGAIGGVVIPFAIITFIFAVFERYKVKLDEGDMFASLPSVPKANEKIKPADAIAGIIFSVIVVVVLLGFPEVIGLWTQATGWVPIFVPEVLRSLAVFIVLWAALEIVKMSVKLVEGQYTKRLAIVTVICNILIVASALAVFLNDRILNPEFLNTMICYVTETDGIAAVSCIFGNINLIIVFATVLALVLDSVETAVKAYKSGK